MLANRVYKTSNHRKGVRDKNRAIEYPTYRDARIGALVRPALRGGGETGGGESNLITAGMGSGSSVCKGIMMSDMSPNPTLDALC